MPRPASPSPNPNNPGNVIVTLLAPVALGMGDVSTTDWLTVERALASLPLQTGVYGLCRLELTHARAYLKNGEPGAAAYEVRLLLGRLARQGFIKIESPKDKGDDR
jgi:hypothetical protein